MPRSATPDLRGLSPAQLDALIDKARKRRESLTSQRVARVREKIQALLRAEGLTLADVFERGAREPAPAKPARPRRGGGEGPKRTVAPKFRNPDDPTQTWAGRGKRPRWLAAALAAGRSEDEFRIR